MFKIDNDSPYDPPLGESMRNIFVFLQNKKDNITKGLPVSNFILSFVLYIIFHIILLCLSILTICIGMVIFSLIAIGCFLIALLPILLFIVLQNPNTYSILLILCIGIIIVFFLEKFIHKNK